MNKKNKESFMHTFCTLTIRPPRFLFVLISLIAVHSPLVHLIFFSLPLEFLLALGEDWESLFWKTFLN